MKHADALVDTRGYQCPVTMAMVSRKMNGVREGEVLEVRFDDDKLTEELDQWCRETGNSIREKEDNNEYHSFFITRGSGFKGETLMEMIRFILIGVRLHIAKILLSISGRRKAMFLITFVSIPEGLRADQWLEQRGEKGYTALPVPKDITAHCGVVLAMDSAVEAEKKYDLLKDNDFKVEDIYKVSAKGSIRVER